MKIVIDISNEDYKNLCNSHITYDMKLLSKQSIKDVENTMMILNLIDAIKNGTPLPKGHGKLIDADSLIKAIEEKAKRLSNADTINGLCGVVALIFDAPTIIEADKESD